MNRHAIESRARPTHIAWVLALAAAMLAIPIPGVARAQNQDMSTVYDACYVPTSGSVYRISANNNTPPNCTSTTHWKFRWNTAGPVGPTGPTGPIGATGGQGPIGPIGPTGP